MPTTTTTLLTRAETAKLLRVSVDGIDTMLRYSDPIPHLKAGRRYLFDRAEVLEWARRQAGRGTGRRKTTSRR